MQIGRRRWAALDVICGCAWAFVLGEFLVGHLCHFISAPRALEATPPVSSNPFPCCKCHELRDLN